MKRAARKETMKLQHVCFVQDLIGTCSIKLPDKSVFQVGDTGFIAFLHECYSKINRDVLVGPFF